MASVHPTNRSQRGHGNVMPAADREMAKAALVKIRTRRRAPNRRPILADVGEQQSDVDGGRADRAFKLPDPFYLISD